jgi:putative hemolysin
MSPDPGSLPALTPFPWWDVIIILLLVAINGLFSMSELALVSARKARLEAMARAKRRGASTALALAEDPGKLLSTVQIGITLIGILAGAYSGSSLGGPVSDRLYLLGVPARSADDVGFAVVIVLTTYASLTIGELIPKQFALRTPEPIACIVALPMLWLSRATAPLVWLLDRTTRLAFRLLGLSRQSDNQVTAEELHLIVAEASNAGVIEESERAIISGVVRLADRPVREVMTPRTEVAWIDADADEDEVRQSMADMPHSRLPVADGSVDNIIGVVTARDMVSALIAGQPCRLRELMRDAPVVPDQMDAMNALEVLRGAEVPMVLVHDEYGHFEGIVTPADLLAAIAGSFVSNQDDEHDPPIFEREDGSWLVSGSFAADMLAEKLGFDLEEDRDYATVAGLTLAVLKRLPNVGDHFDHQGWTFEVVDMDGRKIDKLLITPSPKRG